MDDFRLEDLDSFDLLSAEKVANKYGGDKRKIGEAAQMGLINPTVAVMAGMFIDRMRNAAIKEQQSDTTVAQDVMAPAPQMAGLGATPQAQTAPQMAPQANTQMAAVPTGTRTLAEGGLSSLPVDEDMFPDEYAGGGIVAFQGGDLVRGIGTETYPASLSQTQTDPATLRAYYLSRGMPLPFELMTEAEKAKSDPTYTLGPTGKKFEELGRPAVPGAASSLGEMFSNIGSRIAGLGSSDMRIDPATGKEVSFGEYMRLEDARRAAAAGGQPPTPTATTGRDSIDTLRAKAAASRESMSPENRARYDENLSGIKRIAEDVAPKGKAPEKTETTKGAKAAAPAKEETTEDFLAKRKRMLRESGVSEDPFATDREALRARINDIASQDKENKALAMIMGGLSGVGARNLAEFAQKAGTAGFGQYMKGKEKTREEQKEIDKINRDINKAEDAMKRGDVDKALEFEDKAEQRRIQLMGVEAQKASAARPTQLTELFAIQKRAIAGDETAKEFLKNYLGSAKTGQVDERQLRADWDKMNPGAKMLLARNENITTFDQYKASRMGGGAGAPAAGADPLGLRGGR